MVLNDNTSLVQTRNALGQDTPVAIENGAEQQGTPDSYGTLKIGNHSKQCQ